ncbi:MAG TPA: hypothetical protein V6C65_41545, partial [Allocoleopsis sp.]
MQLRRQLATVADILTDAECSTSNLLQQAPEAIVQGQLGVYHLRQHYQLLSLRLRQVQQILAVVGLGQIVWQRYHHYRGESSSRKPSTQHGNRRAGARSSLDRARKTEQEKPAGWK